ncbi:CsbD family protein [Rhizomonospora bruguierae]|uniref:CsbD family protein n=1 Tax=Rhizomonospora bruguierae TaxID=1581705 RepID=UPI001BD13F3D|nr:CsbD family protein [Micromonospora sp. NBRC 107566]
MGFAEKAQHEFDELKGKVKERAGTATDNERMRGEGRADQSEANAKQAGEHVKDAAQEAKDAFR